MKPDVSEMTVEKKGWEFLPSPEKMTEVEVKSFDGLLDGLEKTFISTLGESGEGPLVAILRATISEMIGALRVLLKGREFDAEAVRKIEQLFHSIELYSSVAAMMSREESENWFRQALREAMVKKGGVKIGDLDGILMKRKQFNALQEGARRTRYKLKITSKSLSKTKSWKLKVVTYLESRYPNLGVTLENLHLLPPRVKDDGRKFLRSKLGNAVHAENIVKDVFRRPKRSISRGYEQFVHIAK